MSGLCGPGVGEREGEGCVDGCKIGVGDGLRRTGDTDAVGVTVPCCVMWCSVSEAAGVRRSDVIPTSVAVCLVCGEAERVLRNVLTSSPLSKEEEREKCGCLSGTLSVTSVAS